MVGIIWLQNHFEGIEIINFSTRTDGVLFKYSSFGTSLLSQHFVN
jgi:hypothetical protein